VLVGRGLLNKQIARQLGISEKTVKAHLGAAARPAAGGCGWRRAGGRIQVEMEVRRTSSAVRRWPARWRFVLLHERRIAARAVLTASSGGGSVRLRRVVPDFPGADAVVVRAVSPAGEVCPAAAVV
jgi:hypothetical protein